MEPSQRIKPGSSVLRRASTAVALFCAMLLCAGSARALELPPLNSNINDFAGMMPAVSVQDLQQRLQSFKTRGGYSIVVLTLASLENESIDVVGRRAFAELPLNEQDRQKAALLIIARKERQVTLKAGSQLRALFPEPAADAKLQSHVSVYFDGFRPDLGIYSGVNYIFRAITGDVRVDNTSDEEKLEDSSITGRGAGAIFTLCLAPYLALVVGLLWGLYATNYRVQCAIRVFIGAVLGSGTAKAVAALMSSLGSYGYDLWYFILISSIALASLGSLTEFWMRGDWCAIPRVKDAVQRKPEDKMGI